MESVFIAARAGTDENAAAPSATVAGPNSASLRVIVMGTSSGVKHPGKLGVANPPAEMQRKKAYKPPARSLRRRDFLFDLDRRDIE